MLGIFSWLSLGLAFACAILIVADEFRHPQKMWIMNLVWPITALYLGIFAAYLYFREGRKMTGEALAQMDSGSMRQASTREKPHSPKPLRWQQVALADTHCGAGCALADIVTEFAIFATGATLLGSELWSSFVWDFIAAWALGIAFQYFTIKPMRDISPPRAILDAVRSDTLSILTFQVGMYAWMALTFFRLFPHPHLHPNQPAYWMMMQIGMVLGFLTAYPMNLLLLKMGWKQPMG